MERSDVAAAAAGFVSVCLLSIPAVSGLLVRFTRGAGKQQAGYEDADGKSTPDAIKAYSATVPKAFVLLFAASGCSVSLARTFLSEKRDSILPAIFLASGSWVSPSWALSADGPVLTPSPVFTLIPGSRHKFQQELRSVV